MTDPKTIDGLLVQWGDRLFYPGNRTVKDRSDPKLRGRSIAQRAARLRERIAATVERRAPQVMVKVTGGGRGMKAIAAHFRYISKNGRLDVEDDRGEVSQGRDAVRDLAEERDALTWMGLQYRYMPTPSVMVEQVRSGVCGTTRMISIREHRFPFLSKVGDWNRFNRNTGGTLVEKCCHFFDLMHLIAGARPVRVLASGAQDVNHLEESYDGEVPDILDNAFVIVEFANGVRSMLDLCMFAEGGRFEQELSVTGDSAKLEATVPGDVVWVGPRAAAGSPGTRPGTGVTEVPAPLDPRVPYPEFHQGASYMEHLALLAAIRSGSAVDVTVEEGLWAVAMGAAAHRSIDEARPVELSEFGLS